MRYIHQVFRVEEGKLGEEVEIIQGKTKFRQAMQAHFATGDASRRAFRLVNSPNTTVYEVVPFLNRRGRLDVCFRVLEDLVQR